jgi:tetratricopeptide (TPR) repeat protein
VHRDVKPSNVVITERGQVKVLDFGLVKQLVEPASGDTDPSAKTLFSTRTRSDVIVGTPLYLSPEQATGKPVDGRSDLFALSAVLYECITGQSAFSGASVIEIGAQVIHVNPPPPSRISTGIPHELDRIAMKGLEKKVESRYQTAEELLKDLRGVLATLSSSQTPSPASRLTLPSHPLRTSALTTLTETLRRPRVSLGSLAIAALVIAILIGGFWYFFRPVPYKPSPVASKWYDEGTEALRNGLFLQAKRAFDQAVSADKDFPMAHARRAEALTELEYVGEATNEMLLVSELVPNRSQLPRVEALYLDAIRSTVRSEFPDAIKSYSEIARLSPEAAYVYFDLGRAYEKNNELERAIDSYIEATNRDPQLAAAFLRVGVMYGRKSEQASALANFQQAETLYQAHGSVEGQAEVFYERGFLFNKQEQAPQARQQLERALELARAAPNQYQEVKTLLKLGDVANDKTLARQHIQEALKLSRANGIDNLTKRGLVDLGNSYLLSSEYLEAKKYYQESLELCQKQKDIHNAARALLSLASVAERLSNADEVISYVEQALPFYRQGGYRTEILQAFALIGRAKAHKGEYEEALRNFQDQLSVARELSDKTQESRAHADIGILFTNQGRYSEALSHFASNYALTELLGQTKNQSLSLINRANVFWRLGKYPEAQSALDQASSIEEKFKSGRDVSSWFNLALARMALSRHQLGEAKAKGQLALSLSGTEFKGTIVEATHTLGLAQTLSRSAGEGRLKCERAVALATESGDVARLSEALLALAEAMLQTGDAQGALATSLRAQEKFARLGKQDSEWLAWLTAARASLRAGEENGARDHAKRAADLLAGLEQKWGADHYGNYLTRPDVIYFRKQLSELVR